MNMDIIIKFAKVREDAIIPSKLKGDAGYDIYGCFDVDNFIIQPNETRMISAGIASACEEDYYLQIQERGSTGSKGIKYSAGVIDSSYRGEWFLAVTNCNKKPIVFTNETDKTTLETLEDDYVVYPQNKAIFQAVVHNVLPTKIKEVAYEELKQIKSERGEGKLGSSNK